MNEENLCCKRCEGKVEDSWHIFGKCEFAKKVWELVYNLVGMEIAPGRTMAELVENHGKVNLKRESNLWFVFFAFNYLEFVIGKK